jgi:predicted DNA binding CopG/RHH family protein
MKKKLEIPKFKSKEEEFEFFSKLDLSEHFEPADFRKVSLPNLKATSKPISLRVPQYILNRIKEKANAMDVPYQSLIKQSLEKLAFGK